MKKIGFIDYYISEWHANQYPGWIEEISKELGYDYKVCYGWAEIENSLTDNRSTDEWCKAYNVEKCETIEEICAKSDYLIILSPSTPEKHLLYAKDAFKCGKRTYVDKTFAPSKEEAEKIYALGEKYGTKFFSTSALRYATEIYGGEKDVAITTTGGGRALEEYVIHQIEMIAVRMGMDVKRLKTVKTGEKDYEVYLEYTDGRTALMKYNPANKFTMQRTNEKGEVSQTGITSDFFKNLIKKILIFFETGEVDFNVKDTIKIMAVREKVIDSMAKLNTWVEL